MYVQLWLLAMAAVAMAAFAGRELFHGRQISARIQKQGSSPFLGQFPMEFAYWILSPIGRLATYFKLSPNVFSWTCLTLGFFSGVAAAFGAISLAGGLSIVSALFDTLDGMVARSRGIASDAGEVLDAAVDRYTEFFLLGGLVIYYRFEPIAMAMVLLALLGSLMVSYSQAKAEALQIEIPKGWMRRPERAAYLGGGAFLSPLLTSWFEAGRQLPLHYPLLVAVALVAVFANATAIRRFQVLYSTLRERDGGASRPNGN
ncbi:MAG: CDP-alcohol phosphatidyltransferase family protein [Bdellovibrionota bacterium]